MKQRLSLLLNRSRLWTLTKWAVVGASSALLDALFFTLFYKHVIQSVLVANLVSFTILTVLGFVANHFWVFRSTRRIWDAFPRFLISVSLNYGLNSFLVWAGLSAGLGPFLAKLIAIPLQSPISFVILQVWVFHRFRPYEGERLTKSNLSEPQS